MDLSCIGGIISPMDGIGPSDLHIKPLENKVISGKAEEIILALSTTMEGDTTNFYLYRKFSAYPVKITILARVCLLVMNLNMLTNLL